MKSTCAIPYYGVLLFFVFEFLSITSLNAQYCVPSNINTYNTNYISKVKFGSINNSSSGVTGGYTYYSSISPMDVIAGETINGTVSVTIDGWNTNTSAVVVWMNFNTNDNDDFEDSGEKFLFTFQDSKNKGGDKKVNVPISILVPETAQAGDARMRIGFIDATSGFTSCNYNYKTGEVEDYNINFISEGSSTPQPDLEDGEPSFCVPINIGTYNTNYISNVAFKSVNNSSSKVTGSYTSYSSLPEIDINVGETITGDVTITLDGWNNEVNTLAVWMNFNEASDDDFEDIGERFLFTVVDNNNTSGNKTINVPITIPVPSSAQSGSSIMRVGFVSGSDTDFTSCDFKYKAGEIEDYKIAFSSAKSASSIALSLDNDSDGIDDDVDLDDDNDGILDEQEDNILSYGGFEFLPVPNNGNNQGGQGVNSSTILPWVVIPGGLGSGGTANIVQVNGDVYNYGNGGPPFDADPNTNFVGFSQHYLDLNGNADVYQSFKITSTTDITYSGYFSPRDNSNSATAKLAIYSGTGNNNTGATLVTDTGTIAIPVQNGSSKATPWTLVQGTVTLSPGIYSFVITMSDFGNFDQGSVKATNSHLDNDGDGIANLFDLDSDNDGIFDADEAGHGQSNTNGVVSNVVGADGIPDAVQISADIGTVNYVVSESLEDSDFVLNYLDIDSDGDGIPDNVEAQKTDGYIAPSGYGALMADSNNNGIDDNYESVLNTIEDTDGDGIPDYLDLDSDNDGVPDIEENGMTNSSINVDDDNDGLSNTFETNGSNDSVWDVNEDIENPMDLSVLPDTDRDLSSGGDLDYRDSFNINPPANASIYFDGGDDYLTRPSFINGLNDVTVMAWVKSDSGNSTNMVILGEDVGCQLSLNNGNRPAFTIKPLGMSIKQAGNSPSITINYDEWHHLAGTYSSATGLIRLYVDGDLVDTFNILLAGAPIESRSDANNTFEIGRFSNSLTDDKYFKGDIDEVRVFDIALTDSQIQKTVYQEIENNLGNVKGTIVAKDIEDTATNNPVSWDNLIAYYPMKDILKNITSDYSSYNRTINLMNIEVVEEQTAPLPYVTTNSGSWVSSSTWLYGNVWDIGNTATNKDWSIVKISSDVTASHDIITSGLIIDSGNTLTIQGDHLVENNWYFELNGTLDLLADSQLIQTINSDLVTSAEGEILRRQEGTASAYWYNYWGSPVGVKGATSLINNNATTNNINNSDFSLNMLKDDLGLDFQFTSNFTGNGSISTYWLYSYINGLTYWDWAQINTSAGLSPGVGYTQKGTGIPASEQQYIFEGKPNNGTILVSVKDKGGLGSIPNVSKTEFLLGNPYASALNIHKFIIDNQGVIDGTIQLWQQWSGSSHNLNEYNGGYAQVNLLSYVRAYQFVGIDGINLGALDGTIVPSKYLPVGQGFITEIIADGNVEFNNDQRVFIKEADADGSFYNGSVFSKSSNSKSSKGTASKESTTNEEKDSMQKIRLDFSSVSGPATRRELVLGFSDYTSDAYDYGYDARCTESNNNDMNLNLKGENMNMQAYSEITADKAVPLNFKSSGNNTFEIRISELDNIAEDQEIYLRDNLTGTYFDLTQETAYSFTSAQGKFNERFEIVFQSEQKTLSTEESLATANYMYYQNTTKTFYAKKLNSEVKNLALINMRGQRIMELENVSTQSLENGIRFDNMATGAYVVCLRTASNEVLTKKVIIK
ncbi:Concanavalin A-like lectin/glucanases superfamily protein [Flaviramulus basaltis]|uniref:Concanavalin A-like lectin/glucanases superfamily protein n=1 Tax=Flaviramulus basaltis TaxID=369401 RepID=A0A1K2IBL3_9FLAO|nr:LamG-like jellyroll fold domain-containing protein [Flaviramulus basaltis]SFZ89805.1 Concanavalin A-like lectin/glucanases superfamily protein [Flaviramulus basaltis]